MLQMAECFYILTPCLVVFFKAASLRMYSLTVECKEMENKNKIVGYSHLGNLVCVWSTLNCYIAHYGLGTLCIGIGKIQIQSPNFVVCFWGEGVGER